MARTVGLVIEPPHEKRGIEVFVCPVCSKEYKTSDGLVKHMEKEHPDHNTQD